MAEELQIRLHLRLIKENAAPPNSYVSIGD
jgi:hypothetical protein